MNASALCEPRFAEPPEALDSVDTVASVGKSVLAMLNPIALFIPVADKTVTGLETVGINDRVRIGFSLKNG